MINLLQHLAIPTQTLNHRNQTHENLLPHMSTSWLLSPTTCYRNLLHSLSIKHTSDGLTCFLKKIPRLNFISFILDSVYLGMLRKLTRDKGLKRKNHCILKSVALRITSAITALFPVLRDNPHRLQAVSVFCYSPTHLEVMTQFLFSKHPNQYCKDKLAFLLNVI